MDTTVISRLGEVVDMYDGFMLDQFGVLHDGTNLLPGVKEAIAELRLRGKQLVLLSNSSKTADFTLAHLPSMGLDPSDFVGAVTSGTETLEYMQAHCGEAADETDKSSCNGSNGRLGNKALCFTWSDPSKFLSDAGVTVASVADASFVLACGCDSIFSPPDSSSSDLIRTATTLHKDGNLSPYLELLKTAASRGLPLVCANPDKVCVLPDGTLGYVPGIIAEEYERIGGRVLYFGKPHQPHFEKALAMLGLDRGRVVHVGDSLEHDVQGAVQAGVASIFVVSGIHDGHVEREASTGRPSKESLRAIFEKEAVGVPTFSIDRFTF